MDMHEFIARAKQAVYEWLFSRYGEEGKTIAFTPDDVFIVWQCKTLQNHKAVLAARTPDNYLFEVTYDGDRDEIYFDAYDKIQNRVLGG